MSQHIVSALGALTLVVVFYLVVRYPVMETRAYDHIANYRRHYDNILWMEGLWLEETYTSGDSPCTAKFVLWGDQVRITRYPVRMLRLIRRIKRGELKLYDLQMMSDTPSTKLPRY